MAKLVLKYCNDILYLDGSIGVNIVDPGQSVLLLGSAIYATESDCFYFVGGWLIHHPFSLFLCQLPCLLPGRVVQIEARLTQEPKVSGSIPGPAIYIRFSFC